MSAIIISSVLSLFIPIIIIGGIIYLVVRKRNGETSFGAYDALITYFYFVTSVSIIIMAAGIGYLLFSLFSNAYDGGEIADDVTLGFTLGGTALVILLLHIFGRRAMERETERSTITLRRVYSFFMLTVFSIAGLVALPMAINETVRYYTEDSARRDDPSGQIATAIVVIPLWIYYMVRVIKETRAVKEEVV